MVFFNVTLRHQIHPEETDQCFYAGVSWNRLKGEKRIASNLRCFVTDSRNGLERLRIKVVTILMWVFLVK